MLGGLTADTIDLMRRQLYGAGNSPLLRKTGTTTGMTTGLGVVWYDLEAALKRLFPAHAPIRNELPRIGLTGPGAGLAANWRALININNANVFGGVAEGKRGGQFYTPASVVRLLVAMLEP